ncbi:DUF3352 domain-containing protein [Calothrix sp. PCC 6303]|uniref:DUF3352 domain-containing protein n=1 Tax=Calothrix sp. PCC 6303 TaxID=1170562 RepID=UPI0002A02EC6|nr:DUF3352 domain-containing protein [Calothrix sp. PCC 6303]AFZ03757.1 hypothetical protein Cal6303_4859 [Calothrix sp. PCC 6303]
MVTPILAIPAKKKKKSSLVLTLSSAGLLVGGGVAAYLLLTQGKPLSRDLPPGVNIIPQDALFTVSLSTNEEQWAKLREYGTKELQTELEQSLVMLSDRFLAGNGYSFQKDIQPWVGEQVTLAVLAPEASKPKSKPVATDGKVSNSQQMVMVLPIKNPVVAKNILSQIKAPQEKNWSDRTYQNIPIKETDLDGGEKFSATVLDSRYLVITDNSQAMEKSIDAYKGKASLVAVPGFADNFPQVAQKNAFAEFYINVPYSAKIASASPNPQLPAQILSQLQNNQGLAGTISLEAEGIKLKGVSWLNPNSSKKLAVENNAGKMQNRIPDDTLAMLSGGNLKRLWADYAIASQGNPLSPISPEQLRAGLKSLTNLDLDRDLLSWMAGEFSVSLIPTVAKPGEKDNFRTALLFLVQTSDRTLAETSFKQLDEVMRSQYQFQIQSTTIAGKPVTNWIAPLGTVTSSHGWLDENVAFLTIGGPIVDKIIAQPNNSLAKTPVFKITVPSEFEKTNGQIFLDIQRTTKYFPLTSLFPNQPTQQKFLDAIRFIGITSEVKDSRSNRYDVFLTMKKVQKTS